ncbi:MAG: HD domain-containing protein [Vampirovibrionales bacterium]|nr:HD domain-containing protein [Vampirovibrionales bacterium]
MLLNVSNCSQNGNNYFGSRYLPKSNVVSFPEKKHPQETVKQHSTTAQNKPFEKVADFLLKAFHLKDVLRSGWVRIKVKQPESVAAHSWSLGLMALTLAPSNMRLDKLLLYALIHDLPEADHDVGDITPYDNISSAKKFEMEDNALKKLCKDFPHIYQAWLEYAGGTTPEARFIKQLDKLDVALQASLYAKRGHAVDDFINYAREKLTHPDLVNMLTIVEQKISQTNHASK